MVVTCENLARACSEAAQCGLGAAVEVPRHCNPANDSLCFVSLEHCCVLHFLCSYVPSFYSFNHTIKVFCPCKSYPISWLTSSSQPAHQVLPIIFNTMSSSALHVLHLPELLEYILLSLDALNLLKVQQVNATWKTTIEQSKPLQKRLFLNRPCKSLNDRRSGIDLRPRQSNPCVLQLGLLVTIPENSRAAQSAEAAARLAKVQRFRRAHIRALLGAAAKHEALVG